MEAVDNPSYFAVPSGVPTAPTPPAPTISVGCPTILKVPDTPAPPLPPPSTTQPSSGIPQPPARIRGVLSSLLRRRSVASADDQPSGSLRAFRTFFRMSSTPSVQSIARGLPRPSDVAPPSPELHIPGSKSFATLPMRRQPELPRRRVAEFEDESRMTPRTPPMSTIPTRRRHSIGSFFRRPSVNAVPVPADIREETSGEVSIPASGETPAPATPTSPSPPPPPAPLEGAPTHHGLVTSPVAEKRTCEKCWAKGGLPSPAQQRTCKSSGAGLGPRHRQHQRLEPSALGDSSDSDNEDVATNMPPAALFAGGQGQSRSSGGANAGVGSGPADDIVMLTSAASDAAAVWTNYLKTCFDQICTERQRPPFRISIANVEYISPGREMARIQRAKLQLVILCPAMLDWLNNGSSGASSPPTGNGHDEGSRSSLRRLLRVERTLAMLLGVSESEVTPEHRSVLGTFDQWERRVVKDQDERFVGDFLGLAMDKLGKVWRQQTAHSKSSFSVMPKKVKQGQNKVLILLSEPLGRDDDVTINIEKSGTYQQMDIHKRRNPYTLQFTVPESYFEVSTMINIVVTKNGKRLGTRQMKCECRLRELDQILNAADEPFQFLCQAFGFTAGDREPLDNFLCSAFQRNVPPHFNLLQSTGCRITHSHEEFPTLLHFAARFGLEKLSLLLMECPGGEQACQLRNASDFCPSDLAEQNGHARLANMMRGYMQMTEFSNVYSILKNISEGADHPNNAGFMRLSPTPSNLSTSTNLSMSNYLEPRPLSETYSVPPVARPVIPAVNSPPPVQPTPPEENSEQYVDMRRGSDSKPSKSQIDLSKLLTADRRIDTDGYQVMDDRKTASASEQAESLDVLSEAVVMNSAPNRNCRKLSIGSEEDAGSSNRLAKVSAGSHEELSSFGSCRKLMRSWSRETAAQDELLEIINDFKNNVFTISEVEKLVEAWRNRNDVQQSFKDKREQLNQMREEYERLQQTLKERMKRPTPFERIRKFFSKNKNKESKDCKNGKTPSTGSANSENGTGSHRPISSLSLHSSCSSTSSGQSSNGSAGGRTESIPSADLDDRKIYDVMNVRERFLEYDFPPTPRPVVDTKVTQSNQEEPKSPALTKASSISWLHHHFETSEDPSQHYVSPTSTRTVNDVLPVSTFKPPENKSSTKWPPVSNNCASEYMNVSSSHATAVVPKDGASDENPVCPSDFNCYVNVSFPANSSASNNIDQRLTGVL